MNASSGAVPYWANRNHVMARMPTQPKAASDMVARRPSTTPVSWAIQG